MKQEDEAREEVLLPFLQKASLDSENFLQTDQYRLQQYLQFFGISDSATPKTVEQDILSCLPPDITYNSEQFASRLLIKITRHSKNYQLVDLEVRLGHFTFSRVSIIHISTASPVHDINCCGNGAFCTVYRCEFDGNILAFKCFSHQRIKCQDNSTSILEKVIEQYCLLRIASCFGVGPKMFNSLGFDIMIHPGCIQICMECCDPFPPKYMSKINEYEQQLKQHLLTLHKLHIIHHDIKMENICFSLAFKSLVFIDFGMSRIVKEEIGFKTLTRYKGTLSYSGDEMTKLFQNNLSHKQNVDLYYNDMIGLKKTFENLRLEQFNHDIALISQLRKVSDEIQKNGTTFYQIYVIKHQIFLAQYNLKAIEQLDLLSLCSLFEFISFLHFSPDIKRLYCHLFQKIRKVNTAFQKENQQLQKEESNNLSKNKQDKHLLRIFKAQTIGALKKISIRNIFGYFINSPARNHQLLDFLNSSQATTCMELEEYLCLLAKAIQINASTVSLAQLNKVCQVAQRRSEQFYAMRFDKKYSHEQTPCFFLASEFLFKKAIKHELKGKYFNIYCYIIINIFVYNMLSNQQLLQRYDILLRLRLPFQNKLLAILKFHTGLFWTYMNSNNLDLFQQLHEEVNLRSHYYLKIMPELTSSQLRLLRMVLFMNENLEKEIKGSDVILSNNTQLQVKMWLAHKQAFKINFTMNIEYQINKIQSQLFFQKDTVLEYYHFYFMLIYYIRGDWHRLGGLICKYRSVIRGRETNIFVSSLQNLKMIRIEEHKNIQEKIPAILALADCNNLFVNHIVHFQLNYYIKMKGFQFNRIRKQLKSEILRLILLSYKKIIKYDRYQKMSDRFMSLAKKTCRQAEIHYRFHQEIGQEMKDTKKDENKQTYYELNHLMQSSITGAGKIDNQQRLYSILALVTLLVKNKEIEKALELGRFLYRITHFVSNQEINKKRVLAFIFSKIIEENDSKGYKRYLQKNRDLYFDYAQMLQQDDQEEMYIQYFSIFADTVVLMFWFQFSELSQLINRVSKKVLAFASKYSSQKYSDAFEIAFIKIKRQANYQFSLSQLQQRLSLIDNPYNIFPLLRIIMLKNKSGITKSNYAVLFSMLHLVNIFARDTVLNKLYPHFLFFYWRDLAPRRQMKLIKKTIEYNLVNLSLKELMKLLIPPSSMILLKSNEDTKKKDSLQRVLKRYNEVIHNNIVFNMFKVEISYRLIKLY